MTPAPKPANEAVLLRDLYHRLIGWYDRHHGLASPRTPAYVSLLFACGLARVGAAEEAHRFRLDAADDLSGKGEAHDLLLEAFTHRIEQAAACQPWESPLPAEWMERRETSDRMQRYVVDRLRQTSAVLEPRPRHPPTYWGGPPNREGLARESACDPGRLLEVLAAELRDRHASEPVRAADLIRTALVHPGADRPTTRALLGLVRERTDEALLPSIENGTEGLLLHREAIDAACRHGLPDELLALLSTFLGLYRETVAFAVSLPGLLHEYVRGLFRLGLCEEADQTLAATSEAVRAGRPMQEWLAGDDARALFRLRTALALASGWNAFGWWPLSLPVLEHALGRLDPAGGMQVRQRARIACEAVESFRLADRPFAQERLGWLVERMPGLRENYTTVSFFARHVLEFAESVVTTAVEVCCRR
jgi:hypothetical protein